MGFIFLTLVEAQDSLLFKLKFGVWCIYLVCVVLCVCICLYTHTPLHVHAHTHTNRYTVQCGGQKNNSQKSFSLATLWHPGKKLGL